MADLVHILEARVAHAVQLFVRPLAQFVVRLNSSLVSHLYERSNGFSSP